MVAPAVIPVAISLAKMFAPALISKVVGDKSGTVAGKVIDIVQQVAGTKDPRQVEAIVAADSKALDECTTQLAELDLEETRLFLEDVADARARDVAIIESGRSNIRGDILAYIAVLAFVGIILNLMFMDIPDGGARDLLLVLMGVLGAIVKNVYSFEFGSSKGSKDKDNLLGQLTSNGKSH